MSLCNSCVMQHRYHLVPATFPNMKLCGIQSLTSVPPQFHCTVMMHIDCDFIFALFSKD